MNKLKNVLKNGVLALVVFMLLSIPNMPVYSAVGSFQSESMALTANHDYDTSSLATEKVFWPAVLAVAAGVALAVVAVVGVVDGWNSIHAKISLASLDYNNNYDKYDFSAFDN